MNGTVLTFNPRSGQGLIRSHEGQRYGFHDGEWLDSSRRPTAGHSVDFEVEGSEARQIVVLAAATGSQAGGERLSEMTANGVVLGGVSVLFGLLALMPAFGVLMAVIGAVTGFIGRRQANISSNSNGKILSVIGISISIIVLLGQVVALVVLSSAFMMI